MKSHQKIFLITQEKVDAFEGKRYLPEALQYDYSKVSFGIFDFIVVKSNGNPYSKFKGIYRNGFINFLRAHGFFKRYREDGSSYLIRCKNNILSEVEIEELSDFVIDYWEKNIEQINFYYNIQGCEIKFFATIELQQEALKNNCHSLFNRIFLNLLPLHSKQILRDTKAECYKPFLNGVVKITSDEIVLLPYNELDDKCVWENHIIRHRFDLDVGFEGTHYYKFIRNVSNAETDKDRFKSFESCIGYLSHNFNAQEKGQAIICYDEIITDINKPQGGTGKGLFAKGLREASELEMIDGKKFDQNERFCFQRIKESTQIVFFDDVKPKLGFDRFNHLLTEGWTIEKKNKDEFRIKPEQSPKVIIASNTILDYEGSTRKRRQVILEFSDFYSKRIRNGTEEPIKDFHGCVFFSEDWDDNEWKSFFSYIVYCISNYLRNGLTYYRPKNILENRLRQTTNEDFSVWIKTKDLELNKAHETTPLYEEFKQAYFSEEDFSQRKFTTYLKKYADLNDWKYERLPASNGITSFKFIN